MISKMPIRMFLKYFSDAIKFIKRRILRMFNSKSSEGVAVNLLFAMIVMQDSLQDF